MILITVLPIINNIKYYNQTMADSSHQIQGRVMVVGRSWWNRGQVFEAFSAREVDEEGEMPDGAVLVLKDGDLSIPEETIIHAVAVLIEQNDLNSHIVRLCANHHIPCIVNLPGLCQLFRWRDYAEVDSRKGVVRKINPGMFTQTSTYHKPPEKDEKEDKDLTNQKDTKNSSSEQPIPPPPKKPWYM